MTLVVLLIVCIDFCGASSLLAQGQGQSQPQPIDLLSPSPLGSGTNNPEEIPLKVEGGTLLVPVLINGKIPLDFTIDSGAAYVSIPADVVSTLIRTETLQKSDFIGQENFTLADGSVKPSATFFIRSLKVGNHLLENVKAAVAPVLGDLLLGQSFLNRFNSWQIDNNRQVLLLNPPSDKPQSVTQAGTEQAFTKRFPSRDWTAKYVVQLSSQASEAEALGAYSVLRLRFPSVLGDKQPIILRTNSMDKGVFYRVMIGKFAAMLVADQFCNRLKALGGSCTVERLDY